jgi:hypothetical protein
MRASVPVHVVVRLRVIFLLIALVMSASFLPGGSDRLAAQAPAMRWDGLFELVTGHSDYPPPWGGPPESANAPSRISRHAISGDGRYVIFESDATNLPFSSTSLYRRDRRTGETEILDPRARNAAISADGDYVAFELCEPWMRADNLPICDVWALDLRDRSWGPMSVAPDGTLSNDHSGAPVLSANGRFIAFWTKASNLAGGTGGTQQIIIRDRDADGNGVFDEPGTAVLDTISVSGVAAGELANADSDSVEISNDGRFVAFRSSATNLVPGDTNGVWDIFLRDRLSGETRRLNVRPAGEQSPSSIDSPQVSMSADGRYVAFASADAMLVPGAIDDNNGALDVFIYDAQSFSLSRVDIGWTPGGATLGNGPTAWPTLSADGRYVSLMSAATNVEVPSIAGRSQVFVVDREQSRTTRVSVLANGVEPDQESVRPAISADASVVLFWSSATNYIELAAPPVADQLYAAVHFEVTPAEVVVPGRGGFGTFTINTQQHTPWWATWDSLPNWIDVSQTTPSGIGSRTLTWGAEEPNPNPTRRSMTFRVNGLSATFTQDIGLSITSVSPSSGPMSGGTTITIKGTDFEPGMWVHVSGGSVPAQFVDSTTLTAVTPPHDRRLLVPVALSTSDFSRFAALDNAFLYLDSTPPFLQGWTTGNEGENGWYVGDVSVYWGWWDQESDVTSTTCTNIVVTTDTAGTTLTCTATSEGGTATASVTFKRDTVAPAIALAIPTPLQLFELNSTATADFTCSDATSGVAGCGSYPGANVIDTSYTGFRHFWVTAMDAAGNFGVANAEYAVSAGYCSQPSMGLKTWLRFEGDLTDVMSTAGTLNMGMPPDSYVAGESGQAYDFVPRGSQSLEHGHDGRLNFTSAMTVAMWLKPGSATLGTLIKNKDQYRLERTAHGTINWMLFHPDAGPSFGTSYARAPLNEWSHVVFTYNEGEVQVYVNGRLDRTWNVSPSTLQSSPAWWNRIRIGGPDEFGGSPYVGAFDELQFFDRALSPSDIEYMFLAGASGLCVPQPAFLDVPSPITTTYGAGTYPGVAILRDATGAPLAGKTITLYQRVSETPGQAGQSTTMTTDMNGMVRWDAPFSAAAGTYELGFQASFEGDQQHAYTQLTSATVNVEKAAPALTWTAPAPIVYGTSLGAAQLNATANVPGSFAYTPGAGALLGAGAGQPLNATFTPADPANYTGGTVATSITVAPAPLVVRAADAAKVYGAPLPAFSATFAGFVNGDSAASLGGALIFGTSATQASAVGAYPIVPGGLSSPNYAIAFLNGTLTIVKGAVAVSVSTSPEPSGYEQPMTFTATVLPVQPAPTAPQGTVRFFDGTTLIGMASIAGNSATLTTAGLDAGTRTIEARYDGDGSFEIGSASASHVVNAAAATPALSITSSRNPSSTGQNVTLTANVSMPSGAVSGSVAFYDGATLLGTSTIVSGRATRSISTLAAGSHAITARFLGSAGAPPAISPVFVQAVGASGWRNRTTSMSLSSSANPSAIGEAVTFTATVTGSSSSRPSGRILFMVDGAVAGDPAGVPVATVSATAARATLSVSGLAHGRHRVTAIYLGDSTYRGSAGAVTQTVN